MPSQDFDDDVTVTFEIPRDVWDMLQDSTPIGEDWRRVAARALEAGLEQANATTNATGRPSAWRGR